MPNAHRLPNRGFRPDPSEAYTQAQDFLADTRTGLTMNELLSAFLRWFNSDPAAALAALAPHLRPHGHLDRPS